MNREEIYNALFELVGSLPEFQKKSRRVKIWNDIAPADMPYLGMLETNERSSQTTGMPTKWILNPEIYIYVSTGGDAEANPYETLNPILDKVCELFNPPHFNKQTLNGLVESVKINGGVDKDGGILGDVAMAVIPLEIITTN